MLCPNLKEGWEDPPSSLSPKTLGWGEKTEEMPVPKSLCAALSRHYCTKSKLQSFHKIPLIYRTRCIKEARDALIDYLHATRSLPHTFAEHIAANSPLSLSALTRKVPFSAPKFHASFSKFLSYHPINEFQLFFESIGLNYDEIPAFLPPRKFFLDEDPTVLDAASALYGSGFPWKLLGRLYKEEPAIFRATSAELNSRLDGFKRCGFGTTSVICICLAFPRVLTGGVVAGLLDCLKSDLSGFLVEESGEDFDSCYDICRKFRMFYDLGLEKGKVGALMREKKSVFLEFSAEVLAQKAEYFCRFDVEKRDVGLLLVHNPEILSIDLSTPVISVVGLLKHVGLGTDELNRVVHKFAHVLGRNRMANLPNVMRAMDLHKWFFYEIMDDYQLLASYCLNSPDEDVDKDYVNGLEAIRLSKMPTHTMNKLKFLHGIGFGENSLTIELLSSMRGNSQELQKRFDCLLRMDFEFSKLCLMLRTSPKIMNQNPEMLEQKVEFLCREFGSSLECLYDFPAYLLFNLENRVKPRCRFHMWLMEKGLCSTDYSIASIVADSEKKFVARTFGIYPAALKHWFETFSYKTSAHS